MVPIRELLPYHEKNKNKDGMLENNIKRKWVIDCYENRKNKAGVKRRIAKGDSLSTSDNKDAISPIWLGMDPVKLFWSAWF